MIILVCCFGIHSAIAVSGVQFPASVAGLIILFFGLVLCDFVLGEKKTREIVKVIDVPVSHCESFPRWDGGLMRIKFGFALKWMNIFFTPS